MLRRDLDDARTQWLADAETEPNEHSTRQESDFLMVKNHGGEILDFHSLRHTCGAWLASTGEAAKTVQAVMRHSSITLTMDRYGHLLPGTESRAADKLGSMISRCVESEPGGECVDHSEVLGAQPVAQRADCESLQGGAEEGGSLRDGQTSGAEVKSLISKDLCDVLQASAAECESAPCWTRTNNLLIKSSLEHFQPARSRFCTAGRLGRQN